MYFSEEITPEIVKKGGEPEVSIISQLPQDDMSKMTMAQIAREGPTPLLPDIFIRDIILGLQDADQIEDAVKERAKEFADKSDRPKDAKGVTLTPLNVDFGADRIAYDHLTIEIDRTQGVAAFTIAGPTEAPPSDAKGVAGQGVAFWPFALARELDAAIMHLRVNEGEIGTWVFRTQGDGALVAAYDELLEAAADDWLVREITLYLKRTLKRVDVSSRSLISLIEPGSCFSGTLLELVLISDRNEFRSLSDGQRPDAP